MIRIMTDKVREERKYKHHNQETRKERKSYMIKIGKEYKMTKQNQKVEAQEGMKKEK